MVFFFVFWRIWVEIGREKEGGGETEGETERERERECVNSAHLLRNGKGLPKTGCRHGLGLARDRFCSRTEYRMGSENGMLEFLIYYKPKHGLTMYFTIFFLASYFFSEEYAA